nr:unnamed protein product [Callosobruchus chinensis]
MAEWHQGLSGVLNGACWEQGGTQQYLPLILLNGSLGGWTAATRYLWDQYGENKSERRRQWEANYGARKNPPTSEAGSSRTQGTGVVSTQSASSEAQPSTSGQSSQKGKRLYSQRTPEEAARSTKRTRKEVGTMKPPESFADKVTVEKMAIVQLNHPETRLSKETALKIKMELGRRAIRGKGVRITSCHPENGAVVVGCANTHTKGWLETQFKRLDPFEGIQLRLGPARSLVRMCKVSTFVPRTTGAETNDDVMLGLKCQSGLDTNHWAVVGGKTMPEGQLLVIHVDGRRRSSYLKVVQEEGRQMLFCYLSGPRAGSERDSMTVQLCAQVRGSFAPQSPSHNERKKILIRGQTTLRALESHKVLSKPVWKCQQKLEMLAEHNKVTLERAPGHSSIAGNENADELARKGSPVLYVYWRRSCLRDNNWTGLLDYLSEKIDFLNSNFPSSEVALLGDFNVHNEAWLGSNKTDAAGRAVEAFAIRQGLTQLVKEPTFFPRVASHSTSLLDLFLATHPVSYTIDVQSPLGNSDHGLVEVKFPSATDVSAEIRPSRKIWHYGDADWDGLRDFFSSFPWNDFCFAKHDVSTVCSEITEVILVGMEAVQVPSIPKVPHAMSEITFRTKAVRKVLQSLDINKATGPDMIPAVVAKKCAPELAPILTRLFRMSYSFGVFPKDWKSACIQPVPKKGSKADPSNYRPIALLSVISKVMEKCVN